jgi:hypothetical protein
MFIFNSDLILHEITSWAQGLLIFVMACAANCAFAAATQGWFARRNRWPDSIALLVAMVPLFQPALVAGWLRIPHEQRYWCYGIGVLIMLAVYLLQRRRLEEVDGGRIVPGLAAVGLDGPDSGEDRHADSQQPEQGDADDDEREKKAD